MRRSCLLGKFRGRAAVLPAALLLLSFSAPAQQPASASSPHATPEALQNSQPLLGTTRGTISGSIVDQMGTAVAGARVTLSSGNPSQSQVVLSADNGEFFFAGAPPGPFQITIVAPPFATQTLTGMLHSGETYAVPPISLALATENTKVEVVVPRVELAETEMKEEEKQRVFGVIPNFYVSYDPEAVPLSSKQKFDLAWRATIDPVTFAVTAAAAGIQQASGEFSGYGQGAQGFGKRFGATYADAAIGTFLGGAVLPSLLKQDPRYFYKGTGSKKSRFFYAIANAVICKGDNGRWQMDYSGILGSLAAGGISNLYYPSEDRNGLALTFENTLIGLGESAGANILQEFVVPKLTPRFAKRNSPPSEPDGQP